MKAFIFAFLASFTLIAGLAAAQTIDFDLRINGNANKVYIPASGLGEIQPSTDLNTIIIPPPPALKHSYLASYLNNALWALVASKGTPGVGETGSDHSLQLQQNLQGSRVFLAFTKGDYRNVDSAIGAVEDGSFLLQNIPSFYFGSAQYIPVKLILAYTNLDLTGDATLQKGTFQVVFTNDGLSGGKPVINIRVV
ncbi:MAG: hypothetical protein HY367_03610 [Candidatus Aenigmarchaeota archaeon]|nr:hypothetical protein [Candidatus Aenigmarchaeota archaeon]